MIKPAAFLALALLALAPTALAQTEPPPPPRVLEDGSTEVSELVVIARRPGRDPSAAKTACLWDALPEGQRAALSARAEEAVRTLAGHDDLPMKNPALTDEALLHALKTCKGSETPEARPFARAAVLAFAAENATARSLAAARIFEPKLEQAWASLTPAQQEILLLASLEVSQGEEDVDDAFVPVVFKLLRAVRPIGVFNPLEYRNGTLNHRVVYYYYGRSLRSVMERRF